MQKSQIPCEETSAEILAANSSAGMELGWLAQPFPMLGDSLNNVFQSWRW